MIDAALQLLDNGLHVVPLYPINDDGTCACGAEKCHKGKHPITNLAPHGLKNASNDENDVRQWFAMWPDANIGIALEPSGLVVVGPDSEEWLDNFEQYGLPATLVAQSGGGPGHRHYYYRRPDGCPLDRICVSEQYDIMSTGITVAPPSMHETRNRYAWIAVLGDIDELPFAPPWVVEMLSEHVANRKARIETSVEFSESPTDSAAASRIYNAVKPYLSNRIIEAIEGGPSCYVPREGGDGSRSGADMAVVSALIRAGLSDSDIRAIFTNFSIGLSGKYGERRDGDAYLATSIGNARRYLGEQMIPISIEPRFEQNEYPDVDTMDVENDSGHSGDVTTCDQYTLSELHSSNEQNKLPFRSAKEHAAAAPLTVDWVVKPYIALGAITEFDAKIKLGKTTFALHMCWALTEGQEFLGNPTTKTKVVYLTEQSKQTFRPQVAKAGLDDSDDFIYLCRHEALGTKWEEIVNQAIEYCAEVDASLLVVDTLSQWAGVRDDAENSTGKAHEALEPLQIAAAAHNLAVLVIRHERKSGGELGDAARGASAFGGGVDMILSLRRPEGNTRRTLRELHAVGRLPDYPDSLVIELTPNGYISHGSETRVAEVEAVQDLATTLTYVEEQALSEKEIEEKLQALGKVYSPTHKRVLKESVSNGASRRIGKGVKGNPYRYYRLGEQEAGDDAPLVTPAPREEVEHAALHTTACDVVEDGVICLIGPIEFDQEPTYYREVESENPSGSWCLDDDDDDYDDAYLAYLSARDDRTFMIESSVR